jgi:hypothetical protein
MTKRKELSFPLFFLSFPRISSENLYFAFRKIPDRNIPTRRFALAGGRE